MNRSISMRYYSVSKMVAEEVPVKPEQVLTIVGIDDQAITFSDGSQITFWHYRDCCENNYADFSQLDDLARNHKFRGKILFESCEGGFRFGDSRRKFFVPCYSVQNGYYTTHICIDYKGKNVLSFNAEFVYD